MPEFLISGVPVSFPFTPYESQKDFMSKVIESLQKNQNALLESPTGTGKTLCLLCASLAWLETHQAHVQFQMSQSLASADEMQRLEEQLKAGVGSEQLPPGFGHKRIRIIYASRTHTQLSQVMGELKRTSYARFRTAIIASRDQLCIHPTVSKETSNHAKQIACRVKVQTRQCHFYNNVERKKDLMAFNNPEDPQSNILDIEDLRALGNKHKCCPYYVTRAAAKDYADIIFMPYNYLIDPSTRQRHGIDLDGAIVIFDEAHNLAQIAEESSSVELTALDITSALQELDAVMKLFDDCGTEGLEGDNFTNSDESLNFELLKMENLLKVKAVLLDVEKELMAIELNKEKEYRAGGEFMFEMLAKTKLEFGTYLPIYQIVDAASGYLTGGGYSGVHAKAYGLGRFLNFLKVVYESDSYNKSQPAEMRKSHMGQFYRVYVYDREQPKKTGWKASNASNGPVRVLAFWCFSPGFSMADIQKQGVRCILLTSGTLKPLASFSSELGIPFPVTLENPHVISPSQVSVSIVKQGPENVILNSNYQNRSDPRYHTSLGYAIMQIAKAVPNGMLVFFPSYGVMRTIIQSWEKGHIMQCIQRYKQIFIEPTNKEEFSQAMEQYYAMVNDVTANGAIFCGVCRGKVSEGLDFVDKNGRAVVITGIPYAPAKDPRVLMKKSYLDQRMRSGKQKETLSGTQWYSQQASRAVNQAIGRVIRHRFDYGAILLLDTRFSSSQAKNELPEWVKSHLVVHETFSSVIRLLNKFFTTIPAEVEAKKDQSEAANLPKPCGMPKVSLNSDESTISSKLGLSARTLYSHKPLSTQSVTVQEDSNTPNLQPAKKKIKMQMITGIVNSEESTPSTSSSSLSDVTNAEHGDKNQVKLELASEALQKCRLLLTKEKFIGLKSSLLKYHKSKEIDDIRKCISILLEQETTRHVISRFRDLMTLKHQAGFDKLEAELRSAVDKAEPSPSQPLSTQVQSTQEQSSQRKSRYAATLSLFNECKKRLTSEQNGQVKTALQAYKNQGNVEELYRSIISAGIENSKGLLYKLQGAVRSCDKEIFERLLNTSTDETVQPTTSTQCDIVDTHIESPIAQTDIAINPTATDSVLPKTETDGSPDVVLASDSDS